MITLTADQQAIVKSDSAIKTFHVHFPNGEHADLSNNDIVLGSVRFKESVCSEQTLRFGCAEASVIEFEAIGLPNVYGVTIECSMTFTVENDAVTVPFGTFVVNSCPRSAGAMYRRKIQAYTFGGKQLTPSDYARRLINYPTYTKPLRLNPISYLMSATNSDLGLNPTAYTPMTLTTSAKLVNTPTWTAGGHTYELAVTGTYKGTQLLTAAYKLAAESVNYAVYLQLFEKMAELGATNTAMKDARNKVLPSYDFVYGTRESWPFQDPTAAEYETGYFFGANGSDQYVIIPEAQTAVLKEDGTTIETYNLSGFTTNATVTPYGLADAHLGNLNLVIEPSFQDETTQKYMYLGAVDFPALYDGFLELMGSFGSVDRYGDVKRVTLSKNNPISVSMSEYVRDGFWWDEYTVEPIGTVRYTYYDPVLETEQTVEHSIGDGLSVYDMTSNAFLKLLAIPSIDSLGQTIQERIEYLLDTYFAPAVQDVDFIPADITMIGMPYLEAGDYLVFDVGDTTVGTYMMARTLSGVALMDDIQSTGGEIINEDVKSV